MDRIQGKAILRSIYAFDGQKVAFYYNIGSQGFGYGDCALVVAAGRVAGQVRNAIGKGGGYDCTLSEALRGRHRKHRRLYEMEISINRFSHSRSGPLTGGRCIIL